MGDLSCHRTSLQVYAKLHAKTTGQRVWLREYKMIDNTEDVVP